VEFTILHTCDWHLDPKNRAYVEPPIQDLIEKAREIKPDLVGHTGDLTTHRGSTSDDIAWRIRRDCTHLAEASGRGLVVLKGNHDDEYSAGMHGTLTGILAGAGSPELAYTDKIQIANMPMVTNYVLDDDTAIAIIMIPCPNKVTIRTLEQNSDEEIGDPGALVGQVIQAAIVDARSKGAVPVVLYHGTVGGAKLGNEQMMTRGMDVIVPRTAFRGAAAVLLGHIHRRQTIEFEEGLPKFCYAGAIAPLTWNEELLEPAALLHTIDTETGEHKVQVHKLIVASQLVERTVRADGVDADIEEAIGTELATIPAHARVRIRARALGAVLDRLTPAAQEKLRAEHKLEALSVIEERTDAAAAKFEIDTDLTLVAAMERYLEIKEITGDDADQILELTKQIEGMVEDEHLDARYEMQPLRLQASNWCQYPEIDVDFTKLEPVTAIDGPNYGGKSNFVRAIVFALYRRQLAGEKMENLVRKRTDRAWVQMTFRSGPNTYRVRREIKLASRTGCKTYLWRLDKTSGVIEDESWVPIQKGTAPEVQRQIDALVGTFEIFMAISYAGQNDIDGLLKLTPAEDKDLLVSVLQRNFEQRQKRAKDMRREASDKANTARTELASLHGVLERASAAEAKIPQAQRALQLAREILANAPDPEKDQETIETALGAVSDAKVSLDGERAKASARTTAAARVKELEQATVDAGREAQRITELEAQRKDVPYTTEAQEALDAATAEISELEGARKDLVQSSQEGRLKEDLAAAAKALSTCRRDCETDPELKELVATTERQAQDLGHQKSEVRRLGDLLATAERQAALIDEVPCEGKGWEDAVGIVDMGECKLLADAKAARDRIPALQQNLAGAEAARDYTTIERQKTVDRIAAITEAQAATKAAAEQVVRDGEKALEREQERLKGEAEAIETKLAAARQRQSTANSTIRNASQIREANARISEQIQEIRRAAGDQAAAAERLGRAQATLKAMPPADLAAAEHALAEAEAALERARGCAATNRQDRQTWTQELAAAEAQVKSLEDTVRSSKADRMKADMAKAKLDEQQATMAAMDTYIEAMHRDGIPFLLLEQYAIPTLQQHMNRYLSGTNMRVEISSERETTTGEVRNIVNMEFRDHRGRHPVSMASGQQATALGMSKKNGLADLHASATGTKIWMSLQDEGFGTMKPEHLDAAKATIQDIAKNRGLFMFVSHVQGMPDCAGSLLEVEAEGVDSKIAQTR